MITTVFLFLNMGTPEMLLIFMVALLLFGGKKLPELARGLGKGIREFKDASDGIKTEIQNQIDNHKDIINDITTMDQPATPPVDPYEHLQKPAVEPAAVKPPSDMPALTYTAPLATIETIHQETAVAESINDVHTTAAPDPHFISEEHQDDEKNLRNSYYEQ